MNETPRDIARLLAQDVERACLELLPQGKKVGHEWCVGSLEGEAGNSLKVRLTGPKAGLWADFAGTERGDLLNLWVDVRKEGIGRAMREAKEFLGIVDSEPYRYSDKEYQRPKRLKAWKPAKPDSPVMAYLKSRGLTEETIKAFKISEMDGNLPPFDKLPNNPGTIVFPSLRPDENGEMELVSVKYLALYREPAKDGSNNHKKFTQLSGANFEPVLFGWQELDKDTRKVSLSEGEVDCATLHQWGIPSLSLPMGGGGGNKQQWVEREYPLLERFDEIFLCLDMDKAGQEATNELIERLGRHRCRVVKLPYKDANECLMKGVTKDEIMECFRKSAFVATAELKTAKEFRDKVHQFLHPPTAAAIGQSLPWSYTFAQDRFAFRPKQVSIWSGFHEGPTS
jgi:twinkle protein